MDRNQFTVLFQAPFWVGIAERWDGEGYQAARVVLAPSPLTPRSMNGCCGSGTGCGSVRRCWEKPSPRGGKTQSAPSGRPGRPRKRAGPAPGHRRRSAGSGSRRDFSASPGTARSGGRSWSGSTACGRRKSAKRSGADDNHLPRLMLTVCGSAQRRPNPPPREPPENPPPLREPEEKPPPREPPEKPPPLGPLEKPPPREPPEKPPPLGPPEEPPRGPLKPWKPPPPPPDGPLGGRGGGGGGG